MYKAQRYCTARLCDIASSRNSKYQIFADVLHGRKEVEDEMVLWKVITSCHGVQTAVGDRVASYRVVQTAELHLPFSAYVAQGGMGCARGLYYRVQ
jgi:hypothetical protein